MRFGDRVICKDKCEHVVVEPLVSGYDLRGRPQDSTTGLEREQWVRVDTIGVLGFALQFPKRELRLL